MYKKFCKVCTFIANIYSIFWPVCQQLILLLKNSEILVPTFKSLTSNNYAANCFKDLICFAEDFDFGILIYCFNFISLFTNPLLEENSKVWNSSWQYWKVKDLFKKELKKNFPIAIKNFFFLFLIESVRSNLME